jgi:hypothetical protein
MITKRFAAVTMAGLLAGTALAAPEVLAEENLAITIYNDNRVLIEDVRDIQFANGRSTITLPNVSSQIMAQTVTFEADDISIVEQNYDFDLLSPSKMMEKAVGQTVTIVRTNPGNGKETREEAKVLSVNQGVVLQIGDRIEVLRDDGAPTRVIFDKVPPNLKAKPTLSVKVDSAKAGTRPAKITYLANGMSWRADYVALFDETAGEMSLQGWATLTNGTDTTFDDAETTLVAGNITNNRGSRRPQPSYQGGGSEAVDQERIGDNYLYPLPGRTTIASRQTKQVSFVDADKVEAKKAYEFMAYGFNTERTPRNADVRIAFSNAKSKGLGAPLPMGTIRVYTKDSRGRAQFIGEDAISHIAGGADISLKIGEAFDVTVQPKLIDRKPVSRKVTDTTMEYLIKNAKDEDAVVTIRQGVGGWRVIREIREENFESRQPDFTSYVWDVPVPAEGETTLRFTIRERTK